MLQKVVGKKLVESLVQSFYLNGELIDKVNVLFLKFDTWLHLTISDGSLIIKELGVERPTSKHFEVEPSAFQYSIVDPVQILPEIATFYGDTVERVNRIVWREDDHYVCGLRLYFGNKKSLIVQVDSEDFLHLSVDNEVYKDLKETEIG